MSNFVDMNVRGYLTRVFYEGAIVNGSAKARIRTANGNSIRGKIKVNSAGVSRFVPTNKATLARYGW